MDAFTLFNHLAYVVYAKIVQTFLESGINVGVIGSSGTALLHHLHTSCPFLGRDLSPGKCMFFDYLVVTDSKKVLVLINYEHILVSRDTQIVVM